MLNFLRAFLVEVLKCLALLNVLIVQELQFQLIVIRNLVVKPEKQFLEGEVAVDFQFRDFVFVVQYLFFHQNVHELVFAHLKVAENVVAALVEIARQGFDVDFDLLFRFGHFGPVFLLLDSDVHYGHNGLVVEIDGPDVPPI